MAFVALIASLAAILHFTAPFIVAEDDFTLDCHVGAKKREVSGVIFRDQEDSQSVRGCLVASSCSMPALSFAWYHSHGDVRDF